MGLRLADFMGGVIEKLATDPMNKKPFKPNEGMNVDPIPASRPNANFGGTRVGNYTRDPVPAVSAEEYVNPEPFRPNTGFVRDPVPARSM